MSAPMNMDEWRRAQQLQKEEERKKKTESAEMLRGYRGGVTEEDLKLAALKEEDRKQHIETAEMLRGYRGGVTEEDTKLSAMRKEDRKKQQDAESLLRSYRGQQVDGEGRERPVRHDHDHPPVDPRQEEDPLAAIAQGSVSAKAGMFDSPGKVGPNMNTGSPYRNQKKFQATEQSPLPPPPMMVDDADADDDDALVAEGATTESMVDAIEASGFEGGVPVPVPVQQQQPSAEEEGNTEEKKAETSDEEEEEHDDVEGLGSDVMPPPSSKEELPTTTVPTAEEVRLDVNFTFGLVTTKAAPVLDGYMAAVEQVVRKAISDHDDDSVSAAWSGRVSYDPKCGPFVEQYQWDESFGDAHRPNVKRAVVTAAVPVFFNSHDANDGISIGAVRDDIVAALQASIRSGHFLELAQQQH